MFDELLSNTIDVYQGYLFLEIFDYFFIERPSRSSLHFNEFLIPRV